MYSGLEKSGNLLLILRNVFGIFKKWHLILKGCAKAFRSRNSQLNSARKLCSNSCEFILITKRACPVLLVNFVSNTVFILVVNHGSLILFRSGCESISIGKQASSVLLLNHYIKVTLWVHFDCESGELAMARQSSYWFCKSIFLSQNGLALLCLFTSYQMQWEFILIANHTKLSRLVRFFFLRHGHFDNETG